MSMLSDGTNKSDFLPFPILISSVKGTCDKMCQVKEETQHLSPFDDLMG